VVLLIFAPWILQKMMTLTLMIFDLLPTLGR